MRVCTGLGRRGPAAPHPLTDMYCPGNVCQVLFSFFFSMLNSSKKLSNLNCVLDYNLGGRGGNTIYKFLSNNALQYYIY